MTETTPTDWQISAPQTGKKGGKTCLVYDAGRKPITINLSGPLRAPFGSSNFEDNEIPRQNLDLSLDEDILITKLQEIDEILVRHAIQNRETLFNGNPTQEKIRESYRSLLRTREGYKPMLRTKVNLDKVRCWDQENEKRNVPEAKFRNADLFVKIAIRNLWFVSATWGLTLEATDIKILEDNIECPFQADF